MSRIEPSTEISHRTDFALLCNARGLVRAVEIGVDQGVNARDFLSRWTGHQLVLVDPYEPHGDIPGATRDVDLMVAVAALAPYYGRTRFFRTTSTNLATHWPVWIGRPQFIYVDGNHSYEAVVADLEAWWPLVEPTGILAGHDFDSERHPGVVRAVEEFAARHGVVVRLTHEAECRSWYIYRTEPPDLIHRFFDASDPVPNPHAS